MQSYLACNIEDRHKHYKQYLHSSGSVTPALPFTVVTVYTLKSDGSLILVKEDAKESDTSTSTKYSKLWLFSYGRSNYQELIDALHKSILDRTPIGIQAYRYGNSENEYIVM